MYAFDEWMCTHKTETLQTGLTCARLMSGCVHTRQRDTTDWVKVCAFDEWMCTHKTERHYRLG